MYRYRQTKVEVLLVHPGGPFWAHKDQGSWSIPKGEYTDPELPLAAAQREFTEETGHVAPPPFTPLGSIQQPSRKIVTVWACEGDLDPTTIRSTTFKMEWPSRSGLWEAFPEVDRAEWCDLAHAREKILPGQRGFLEQLEKYLQTLP